MKKRLFSAIFSVCLVIIIGCLPPEDDKSREPLTFSLLLDSPKSLFIDDDQSLPSKASARGVLTMDGAELYQITAEDLIAEVEFQTEEDTDIVAQVGSVLKLSDKYFVVWLETWDAEDYNNMELYANYTLVIDRTNGMVYDLGKDYGMFNWTNQLNDEPMVIDDIFYTIEGSVLYKIDLESNTVTPLNNAEAMHVGAFTYLTDGYILASVLVGGTWRICLLSESLTLPEFLDSDPNISYVNMGELVQNHYETFSPINDVQNNLFDVEINFDSETGTNTAELIQFGLTAENGLSVIVQHIQDFIDTTESYYSCANSANPKDCFRMLVLEFGYIYVESNAPLEGFSFSSGQKDLSFLFDDYSGPKFEFYNEAKKAVWIKDSNTFCIFDIISDTIETEAEEITIPNIVSIYTMGTKIVYTKMVTSTSIQTFEYNQSGEDILLSEDEMSVGSIIEFE